MTGLVSSIASWEAWGRVTVARQHGGLGGAGGWVGLVVVGGWLVGAGVGGGSSHGDMVGGWCGDGCDGGGG